MATLGPAVAGTWYPGDPSELRDLVEAYSIFRTAVTLEDEARPGFIERCAAGRDGERRLVPDRSVLARTQLHTTASQCLDAGATAFLEKRDPRFEGR